MFYYSRDFVFTRFAFFNNGNYYEGEYNYSKALGIGIYHIKNGSKFNKN